MRWGRSPMLQLRDRKLNGACIVPETVGKVKISLQLLASIVLLLGVRLCAHCYVHYVI